MRILYFSRDYSPHDHRFLSACIHGGHETYYLRLEQNNRQTEDRPVPAQVEQVHWIGGEDKFRWRRLPRLIIDFRRVVERIKPDLIHAGPIQTCAFIAVASGYRPILTMSWGFDLMQDVHHSSWMKAITKFVLKRSTFFTSDAAVTRDVAIKYGMNPDRTSIIPWGVDLKIFKPKNGRQKGRHAIVLCNRAWEPRYGVDILALAFVMAAKQNEKINLTLAGGGSQAQAIRNILSRGGVLERVQFAGQLSQKDLPDWYNEADLYVSPSHVDGTSVSLLEALACGTPVLVSDIPGNKEWVQDGLNGWLYADGNAQALSEKMLAAFLQPERLGEIGRAGRQSVQERGDWEKNESLLLKTYEQVMNLHAI
jgi:glycosyltransferase involved in cell wall biosynthesis